MHFIEEIGYINKVFIRVSYLRMMRTETNRLHTRELSTQGADTYKAL